MRKTGPKFVIKTDDIGEDGYALDVELPRELVEGWVGTKGRYPTHAVSGAKVKASLRKAGKDFLIEGRVKLRISAFCSRCIREIEKDVESRFETVFMPKPALAVPAAKEDVVTPEDPNVEFFSGDDIDVESVLHEEMVLSLPSAPLCSEACKGICPGCGADLNIEKCSCPPAPIDPRLEPLSKIKLA